MYILGYLSCDGALVVVGDAVGVVLEVPVDAVLGDVDAAVGKPPVEMKVIYTQRCRREGLPVDRAGLVPPVVDGVGCREVEGRIVGDPGAGQSR